MEAEILSNAMGNRLPLDRYEQLCPAFNLALVLADCVTVNRVAMWCAQVGHESGGLLWMEEIADGSAYEGRNDLGNVFPGDGVKFKGHGPIQITGRHNHTEVSKWAFDHGYVNDPNYFVQHPEELGGDKYGFLGVVWYWTVARDMNAYADNEDIYGATRAVNGGLNGIDDRIRRWNSCRVLGDALLPTGADVMGTFTNSEGHEVTSEEAIKWIDKRVIEVRQQLCGDKDDYRGWPQLGNRTVVDALAEIGKTLKIEGFGK